MVDIELVEVLLVILVSADFEAFVVLIALEREVLDGCLILVGVIL